MKKYFLSLVLFFLSWNLVAQENLAWKALIQDSTSETKWVKEIKRLIDSKYVLLKENYKHSYYNEMDIDNDGKKEIIVAVTDTLERATDDCSDCQVNKIFVFKQANNSLTPIDSSAEYEAGGRGSYVEVSADSLILTNPFHRGEDVLTYKFDPNIQKYLLIKIEYNESSPPQNGYIEHSNEIYDIKTQTLSSTDASYNEESGKERKDKIKNIHIKLPSNFSLRLSALKTVNDNYDYYSSILDE